MALVWTRGNALVQARHTVGLGPDFLTFCMVRGIGHVDFRQAMIF